jgi:hypothetical protein
MFYTTNMSFIQIRRAVCLYHYLKENICLAPAGMVLAGDKTCKRFVIFEVIIVVNMLMLVFGL